MNLNFKDRYFGALVENAIHQPERLCFELHSAGQLLTCGAMEHGIAAAAGLLKRTGVSEADIVLIFAGHNSGTLFSFFGAQALGAIPTLMPPPTGRQPLAMWRRDHEALVARLAPAVIVCDENIREQVAHLGGRVVLTSLEIESAEASDILLAAIRYDSSRVAFLQHSSGTTGLKKGVMVTYGQLESQIRAYVEALNFSSDDCVVSWLPIYHDMGLIAATLMPFVTGVPATIIDTLRWLEEPSTYLDILATRPNSFSWLPNFAFPFLAQRGALPEGATLSGVKAIINCSEPCKPDAMAEFHSRFNSFGLRETAVQVCYAMAEYVFAVTQTDRSRCPNVLRVESAIFDSEHRAVATNGAGRSFVSAGKALPETHIRIGAGSGRADGIVDEIFVRGSSLCSGYFRNPEITEKKFVEGWYRTGDLGFVYENELYITGREDDVIIVRGKNIYAHDVEMLATQTQLVRAGRVVALGIEDGIAGTQKLVILAELTADGDAKLAARSIRAAVREVYGLSPSDIVLLASDTLIKTTSGKISRSENRNRYLADRLESWGSPPMEDTTRAS